MDIKPQKSRVGVLFMGEDGTFTLICHLPFASSHFNFPFPSQAAEYNHIAFPSSSF
jgi:hypothetical protein